MSDQGGVGRFLLIRVKLNILIFYPSTSSIWDPSRAGNIRENRAGHERRFIEKSVGQEKTIGKVWKRKIREKREKLGKSRLCIPPKGEVPVQGASPRGAHRWRG